MTFPLLRTLRSALVLLTVTATPAFTQAKPPVKAPAKTSVKAASVQALVGSWAGTVSVQLGDSSINAPVFYTFVETPTGLSGTAMVPGQGMGPISNVVRTGSRIQFRVTAPATAPAPNGSKIAIAPEDRLLEHDGKVGADGGIEGVVNLKGQVIAKFKIAKKN